MTDEARFQRTLAAARAGAEWAWAELYRELSPVVLGYLRGQRAPYPEDLVSEIFLQVVRDIDSFEGTEANFRSWLFTIAHHRMIDARRFEARRPSDATETEIIDRKLGTTEVENEAVDNVATSELAPLFDVCTEEQRAVLLLRIVGGLTMPEIAEIVGKRPGAVKALQRRGLAQIRAELERRPYPSLTALTLTELS